MTERGVVPFRPAHKAGEESRACVCACVYGWMGIGESNIDASQVIAQSVVAIVSAD
jgi:hypothetical protein